MRNLKLPILAAVFLTIFSLITCTQTSKSANKDKALTEKENELLKKENELLKKEQELNQKTVKPTKDNQTIIQQQSDNAFSDNLDFLNKFNNKYSHDVKLFANPIIEKRLRNMLGSKFDFMKNIWEVTSPIEITNGLLYAWGMQAHSGGDSSAVLMIDINKNVLYVGIREDGKEKIYSEDGSSVPKRLQVWANEPSKILNDQTTNSKSSSKSTVYSEEYALECVKDYYEFYNADECYSDPKVRRVSNNVFYISVKYCLSGKDGCYTKKNIGIYDKPNYIEVKSDHAWYSKVLILTCTSDTKYTIGVK